VKLEGAASRIAGLEDEDENENENEGAKAA